MSDYKAQPSITYRGVEWSSTIVVCSECGAMVMEREVHTNWHERQQPEPR